MTKRQTQASISLELAEFIAAMHFEQLDKKALANTRYALLDAIGVSVAATSLGEGVDVFLQWVQEQQAPGRSTVFGLGFSTTPGLAAFANGALAHALDFEDTHDRALVHPNAAVIPAVLAVAQHKENVSGKELLAAIAVGCEVSCRLGFVAAKALDSNSWYPPPIVSAYGATAAVAKVLQLSASQIVDAFSLCLLQATCSAEIKHNPQSTIRAIRDAFPAQAGVMSAQLAEKGLVGFSHPLEGKDGFFSAFTGGNIDLSQLTDGLGESFAIADISFKPWPSCRGTHTPVELVLQLSGENKIDLKQVNSIRVFGNDLNRMLAEPLASKQAPDTAIDAKFSIPFCVASALVNGSLDLDSFTSASLQNSRVLEIASKVSYQVEDGFDSPLQARIELSLSAGGVLAAEGYGALGGPERPLVESELVNKFLHCMSHDSKPNGTENNKGLAEMILSLERHEKLNTFFSYL